jgi:hypothetical protein
MRICRRTLLAAWCMLAAAAPAWAADPVFPLNSRIGLVPPPGFVASTRFPGFENPQGNAAILLVDFPGEAFADIEKGFTDEALRTRGMTVEKREPLGLKDGRGFVVSGRVEAPGMKRYETIGVATLAGRTALVSMQISEEAKPALPDDMLVAALATVTVREQIPEAERLTVLPYRLGELAGFRIVRSGADGSAVLTDGPLDAVAAVEQPFFLIGLSSGEMPKVEERDRFAARLFSGAPGLKEVRITRAEPLRMGNQPGFEILAEAKDEKSGTEVSAVQWVRFGRNNYFHMFGIARRDAWASVFPRLRAIRDGVDLR